MTFNSDPSRGPDVSIKDLSQAEKFARLQLSRSENVGPVTFRHLLARFASAVDALKALPELARRGGRKRPLKAAQKSAIQAELDALDKMAGHLIVYGDSLYPHALAATEGAPPVLMALGHLHLLEKKNFAMVGARNASAVGLKIATGIAREIGEAGYVLTSGMARGIDAAAHQGAMNTGTIAVVAGGVDVIYPKENTHIYQDILSSGLILSEMPLGTQPQARHFPRRNRIISGLACGVLVVEATFKSGSLITARLALEQGREVFAIPGSPLDPRATGPNSLIRQGAVLTENSTDILDVLSMMDSKTISEPTDDLFTFAPLSQDQFLDQKEYLDQARLAIKEKLSHTAVAIDDLIRLTDCSPAEVQSVLLELELAGEIIRHAGNRVSLG